MDFHMRNTTFISSIVLSVVCVSAANAAVAFDSFTVAQSATADDLTVGIDWATPSSSQPIFGASGSRSAFAYNGVCSTSVSAGTATFTSTNNGYSGMGLFYSGSAQDLTGYTFSFDLNMTGANSVLEVHFGFGFGSEALFFVNYTTAGSYTVDLSTVGDNGVSDYTAITDIMINLQAQSGGSATVSNFTYTPAPGAIALLGAAGLIGARRRRD